MVSEGRLHESRYFTRTKALREEIQALLASKQIEGAKTVQEELTLVESLYAPYHIWPFHVGSTISSTVLELIGSLLVGVLTEAVVQYSLPAILTFFFHTP
jgi:hypothetical protein